MKKKTKPTALAAMKARVRDLEIISVAATSDAAQDRARYDSTERSLRAANERVTALNAENYLFRQDIERYRNSLESYKKTEAVVREQCNDQLKQASARARAPFERKDVESMSQNQLVSLADHTIQEARRRGLLEAEGLADKHRTLMMSSDEDLLSAAIHTMTTRLEVITEKKASHSRETYKPMDFSALVKDVQQKPKCHCGIELIRGQCEVHTQDWRGGESCTCGRRFEFCKEEYTSGRAPRFLTHVPSVNRHAR